MRHFPTLTTPNKSNHPATYAVLLIVFFFTVLQLITLHDEYFTFGWTIQHDEKLIIPDARAFYLSGDQRLDDYFEPVSAGFGILGQVSFRWDSVYSD